MNSIVNKLLFKRGIKTREDIEEFFSENPQKTYDPFLLKNMDKAVLFLEEAFDTNKKIAIYGDYDVDGVMATTILYKIFQNFTDNLITFLPSRFNGGYGLNKDDIKKLKDRGVDIIVTVDLGIVNDKEVLFAKELGIEVLITDHHLPDIEKMPDCIVINQNLENSKYPFKEICGAMIAFKLSQALVKKFPEKTLKKNLHELIDLVGIATVCDIMPLIDENRTVLKYALKDLKEGNRLAINTLLNLKDIDIKNVDVYHIAFIIGPHINAAGRIGDASLSFDLLNTNDGSEIIEKVEILIDKNNERKNLQKECFNECVEIVNEEELKKKILFLKPKKAHEGVIGIVAGKIKEKYYLPTTVLSEDEGLLKASCRSIENIDITAALRKYDNLFEKLGGHKMAAGFSIKKENFTELKNNIIKDMIDKEKNNPEFFEMNYDYDLKIKVDEINLDLAKEIEKLAPFGNGNNKPVFKIEDIKVEQFYRIGKDKEHLKFKIGNIDAILFYNAKKYIEIFEKNEPIDIYANLNVNEFKGNKTVQVIAQHIT
ncbi:MAG: single-stranded-DNA-specific exonuclease RecJ [Clostridiales Family XIII bacterium]|nr:single-stranded-DNA-specific exonuclease RecJ [Clostridiales Family XIII bacterium]